MGFLIRAFMFVYVCAPVSSKNVIPPQAKINESPGSENKTKRDEDIGNENNSNP